MSFSFGGLGHSLEQVGGSVASFTDHISEVIKDVRMEGTEKVGEGPDSDRKESEGSRETLRWENQRLKRLCSHLEEKYEASELQIKRQTLSYRHQLQQKEAEMKLLKARQIGLKNQLLKLQSALRSTTASPSLGYRINYFASASPGDDLDFADLIWSQQEISRLSNEVLRLEAEVSYWKHFSQTSAPGANSDEQNEIYKLQVTIRELEQNRNEAIDDHQLEKAVLQNVYQQTLAEIRRRYHQKSKGYEKRIKELENLLEKDDSGLRAADESVIEDMQNTIQVLQTEKVESTRKIEELEDTVKYINNKLSSVESERDALRREWDRINEEKKERTEECESQPSVLRQSDTVTEKERVLSESTAVEEVSGPRQVLSDAEKEMTPRCSLTQGDNLIGDDLKLEGRVYVLEQENSSGQGREALQLALWKVSHEQEVIEGTAPGGVNVDSEVEHFRCDLEADGQKSTQGRTEKELPTAELGEFDGQKQTTRPRVLMKGQLSEQQNEGNGINGKVEHDLNDEKGACPFEEEQMDTAEELDAQNEESPQSQSAVNDLHRSDPSRIHNLNIPKENAELKEHIKQEEEESARAEKEPEDSDNTVEDDSLKGRETTVRKLQQSLSEMEELNGNLKKAAFNLKVENGKLVLELEDVRRRLEETTVCNRKNSLETKSITRALKIEKGQLIVKLCRAEKKLLEKTARYEQAIKELTNTYNLSKSSSQLEQECLIQRTQEKDDEILQLKKSVEQMDADHRETKEMLSSALEEHKRLTRLIKDKEICIEKLERRPELQELLEKYGQVLRENEILQQTVEEQDVRLASTREENEFLQDELECLREDSQTVPVVDPQTQDRIMELECEVYELNAERVRLEDEIKQQQKIIEDQRQGKLQRLRALQDQKRKLDDLTRQHEQMNIKHAQLLSAKEEIKILQNTIEQMKTRILQKPSKYIPTKHSDVFQVTTIQHLPVETRK